MLQVTFISEPEGTEPTWRAYPARIGSDSTFRVHGQKNKGIPPGKYRVAVQVIPHMSDEDRDRLRGEFGPEKSPFIFDLTSDREELVLDIGKPPN